MAHGIVSGTHVGQHVRASRQTEVLDRVAADGHERSVARRVVPQLLDLQRLLDAPLAHEQRRELADDDGLRAAA
jgi:hypothetical protein